MKYFGCMWSQNFVWLRAYCQSRGINNTVRQEEKSCESNKYYILWVFVCVALVIRHAKRVLDNWGWLRLWLVWIYCISPHSVINGTVFEKNLLNIKPVFLFSLQRLCETFLTLWRIRQDIINVPRSPCKVLIILSFLNVASIFLIDFRKILKCQISWETGRHTKGNSCILQFSECA